MVKLVNYYRAMAGLPGDLTLSLAKSLQAQQAALMFDANDQLSHTPPTTWKCYTADGAAAAGKSNIAWGTVLNSASPTTSGLGAVPLYVMDGGVDSLGHRRWVFSLTLDEVGTGDTPQGNALWVLGFGHAAPSVPNGVPWPPRGYVPWDSAIAEPGMRWSFSYPGADFSAATVTMTDDAGTAVPVTGIANLPTGYAENALAWSIGGSGQPWSRAPADTRLGVTVSNVKIGGSMKSFSYDVTFIKP